VVVNTRNSVPYKKFYNDQVNKFIVAYDEEVARSEKESQHEQSEYSYLFTAPVPVSGSKQPAYTMEQVKEGIEPNNKASSNSVLIRE
jgi:hypothetical protein